MNRPLAVVLAVLTVVVVGVGIWFYVGDEYPFQVDDADVVALTYECRDEDRWVFGFVEDPPADLAGWIRGWERDASGEDSDTTATIVLMLRDGRRLRLDVGGKRGYGALVGADGRIGPSLGVHFNDAFVWYVEGLCDGLGGDRVAVPATRPSTSPPSPSPSPASP